MASGICCAIDILINGIDQLLDIAKNGASDSILCQVAKEPFHHVEPRCAGRGEVNVEARVTFEPLL
jgi:hypothetical protein